MPFFRSHSQLDELSIAVPNVNDDYNPKMCLKEEQIFGDWENSQKTVFYYQGRAFRGQTDESGYLENGKSSVLLNVLRDENI